MPEKTAAVILAAGKGTRMRSALPKVLHPVLGRPMVACVVDAALAAGFERVVVVVGAGAEEVESALTALFPEAPLSFALQVAQRGTGDAVRCALPATTECARIAILCGDTPALCAATLRSLWARKAEANAALCVATFLADDPTGYGRIVRDEDGNAVRIVEQADATPAEREIDEVNAGLYLADREALASALARIDTRNAQGELYLTDVVAHIAAAGGGVATLRLDDPIEAAGINSRGQLAALEGELLARRRRALQAAGVTLTDPGSVRIEASVEIGEDSVIGPNVQLLGATRVGRGVRIDQGCVVTDTVLDDDAHLLPYVVATEAVLHAGASAGPFAHLRPGTELFEGAKVGNFVETKKARLGPGTKANHLSYLGDCELGARVNVGAGTITCNYDGVAKHRTIIEDGVFIGSDTQLVAPVTIGENATIGAGSTITRDVPAGALGLSRAPQREVMSYYEKRRKPREDARRRALEEGGKR